MLIYYQFFYNVLAVCFLLPRFLLVAAAGGGGGGVNTKAIVALFRYEYTVWPLRSSDRYLLTCASFLACCCCWCCCWLLINHQVNSLCLHFSNSFLLILSEVSFPLSLIASIILLTNFSILVFILKSNYSSKFILPLNWPSITRVHFLQKKKQCSWVEPQEELKIQLPCSRCARPSWEFCFCYCWTVYASSVLCLWFHSFTTVRRRRWDGSMQKSRYPLRLAFHPRSFANPSIRRPTTRRECNKSETKTNQRTRVQNRFRALRVNAAALSYMNRSAVCNRAYKRLGK